MNSFARKAKKDDDPPKSPKVGASRATGGLSKKDVVDEDSLSITP